jgi:hypothetical protein
LGTSGAVSACECAEKCINDEELLTELEECRTICYEDYGMEAYNYNLLRDCNDNCETSYAYRLARCRKSCGSFSPVRAIRRTDYILFADWAVLGVDPSLSEANRVSSDWLSVDGPDVVIPPFQVPAPWPDVHDQRNVCYGIQVIIFYDDGVVCTGGLFWNCFIRG